MSKRSRSARRLIWALAERFLDEKDRWHTLARMTVALTSKKPSSSMPPDIREIYNAIHNGGKQPTWLNQYNPSPDDREMFETKKERSRRVGS